MVTTDYDVYPRQRCHPPSSFAKPSFDGFAQTSPTLSGGAGDTLHWDATTEYLRSQRRVSLLNKYLSVFTLMYIFSFINRPTLKASEFHICAEINRCFRETRENEDSYGNSLFHFVTLPDQMKERERRGEGKKQFSQVNIP